MAARKLSSDQSVVVGASDIPYSKAPFTDDEFRAEINRIDAQRGVGPNVLPDFSGAFSIRGGDERLVCAACGAEREFMLRRAGLRFCNVACERMWREGDAFLIGAEVCETCGGSGWRESLFSGLVRCEKCGNRGIVGLE